MRYTAKGITNMSLRAGHTTSYAKIGQLNAGVEAYGDELWIATSPSGSLVGDKWLHVKQYGTTQIDAWLAIVHMGVKYCDIVDSGVEPVDDVVSIIKAVVYYVRSDGSTGQKDLFPDETIT